MNRFSLLIRTKLEVSISKSLRFKFNTMKREAVSLSLSMEHDLRNNIQANNVEVCFTVFPVISLSS